MRLTSFAFFLLFSASLGTTFAQVKPEYDVNVHVNASRIVLHGNSALHYQYLSATIDGKKYELESIRAEENVLNLGDYKAHLLSDQHGKGEYDSWRVYEFQFPDQKRRRFLVVGQLE